MQYAKHVFSFAMRLSKQFIKSMPDFLYFENSHGLYVVSRLYHWDVFFIALNGCQVLELFRFHSSRNSALFVYADSFDYTLWLCKFPFYLFLPVNREHERKDQWYWDVVSKKNAKKCFILWTEPPRKQFFLKQKNITIHPSWESPGKDSHFNCSCHEV